MQMQTAQTGGNDTKPTRLNPELPVVPQPESPPTNNQEDISGLEADERAIAEATVNQVKTTEGRVFKTLRESPEPIPVEQNLETDPVHKIKEEIEVIMQADLVDYDKKANKLTGIFADMPADKQALFKAEGERLANEIVEMIHSVKYNPGEVQGELARWLKIIPDVNQPWIVQMATIKKDKILNLVNQIARDRNMLN